MNNNFENEIIRVFQNTTNSYKYYWWYSILNLIKRSDNKIISMVKPKSLDFIITYIVIINYHLVLI